jgi:hypothetical protein
MFRPRSVVVGNWAPVTILSLSLDYAIWGRRPFGYHLTNLVLHAIAAALFAIHPVQVESVAWVAERKNVLGMSLLLTAFLAWLRVTKNRWRPGAYAAFLLFFAAALLAKAQAVFLPPLLLLYEWIERPPPRPSARRCAALLLPAFALAIGVGILTMGAQQSGAQLRPTHDLLGSLATAPVLVLGYVKDLLLPMNRAAVLPRPIYRTPWELVPGAAWLVLMAWVAVVLAARRERPHGAFFSLWFLGALAPVLNFVPLSVLAADRYQY